MEGENYSFWTLCLFALSPSLLGLRSHWNIGLCFAIHLFYILNVVHFTHKGILKVVFSDFQTVRLMY